MSPSPITKLRERVKARKRATKSAARGRAPAPSPGAAPGPRQWKYLSPKDMKGFKNMLFAARTIVEGHYAGKHKSPFRGSAPEFADHRQYHPGDEMRTIDWGVYARTDRYFVKLFEKETDMNTYILLDASASMAFGGRLTRRILPDSGLTKFEYACYLSAALAYLMIRQGDKAGLTIFDKKIRQHLPQGSTTAHLYKLLSALEQAKPDEGTSLSTALQSAYGNIKRKGLLIVISDFLDDANDVFKALNLYRHRGFEVLLFHVLHHHEYRLPKIANANFIDLETYERMTCLPGDLEKSYSAEMDAFIGALSAQARARGIDYNFLTTETHYSEALHKYLLKRNQLTV